ncbi:MULTISPECIES: TetR/AcrR family transcriptional regulator [Thermotoga]|uniref:TetR/AcrR family transcriptional regulator n=1 Tax=Thermotoga TaxID=2335 RepID=UPI000E82C6E6|nr:MULTISPECIES: TetR/AcrR family transcriptional regulator [Thermotoga]HBF10223.1 TetR/AcrR family transcriptional regulator [Thermotoga neapolitana]
MLSKKEAILKAAIEVFGKRGYERATTDEIAERAGVAKGLIFHHFKSKENLYHQAYRYVVEKLQGEFENFLRENKNRDIFDFMEKWMEKKLEYSANHPEETDFLVTLVGVNENLRRKILSDLEKAQGKFFGFVREKLEDLKLAEGVTEEVALKFLMWFFKGFEEIYLRTYQGRPDQLKKDTRNLVEEVKVMLKIVKRGMLKE